MKYIRHFDSQEDYEAFINSLTGDRTVLAGGPESVNICKNIPADKALTRWYKDGVLVKEYDVVVISDSLMGEIGVIGRYDTCIIGENVYDIEGSAFERFQLDPDTYSSGNHYYIPKTVSHIGWHAFGGYDREDPLDITYEGTKNEWLENISKEFIWNNFDAEPSIGIIHCKDGDMEISDENGNGGVVEL